MDYRWLTEQFDKNPAKSKAGLARALGLEPSAISKILANIRQIKAHEYVRMLEYFDLPQDHVPAYHQDGLHDSGTGYDEWSAPQPASQGIGTLPRQIESYTIHKDSGSVRFCKGETVLIDPERALTAEPLPFVMHIAGEDVLGMCYISHDQLVHIQPFGGRSLDMKVPQDQAQIRGHIFAKMELV